MNQKPKPHNPYLARDDLNRRKAMANTKTRFWKASGLLLALFVAYIIYLNFIGFHLRSSKQPSAEFAQHLQQQPENGAQASRKEQQKSQTSAESSHNYDQKPQNQHQQQQQARFSGTPEKLKAVALKSIPHDTSAFTQGLFYDDEAGDHLIECTGMWGQSSIRRLRASDGQVLQSRLISDSSWFGEGCFKARAGVGVMMTWKNWVAFEFNTTTFEEIRRIPWPREGWGISGDGGSKVYATDGSNSIFSLHPSSYADVATIPVKIAVQSSIQTSRLNEVELVDNQILSNVWGENYILRIDPESGLVTAIIECSHLRPESSKSDGDAVLNGIAWDAVGRRLWLTGKRWPVIYQIELQSI